MDPLNSTKNTRFTWENLVSIFNLEFYVPFRNTLLKNVIIKFCSFGFVRHKPYKKCFSQLIYKIVSNKQSYLPKSSNLVIANIFIPLSISIHCSLPHVFSSTVYSNYVFQYTVHSFEYYHTLPYFYFYAHFTLYSVFICTLFTTLLEFIFF